MRDPGQAWRHALWAAAFLILAGALIWASTIMVARPAR